MNADKLYEDILKLLALIKDDEEKLTIVLSYLEKQILNEYQVEKKMTLPEKYKNTILQIADAIDTGIVCFLNPDTMEIEQVQNSTIFDLEEYKEQNDDMLDEFGMNYQNWDNYIKFEPLERDEVYRIMENFTSETDDTKLAGKLEDALSSPQPEPEFIRVISQYGKNTQWVKYKKQQTINRVKTQLLNELRLI
jgi:uncharacterized UPF0160 family protein